jgi:hypothetical protein
MPSRREFIQAGIAASVVPIAFPIHGPARAAVDADVATPHSHRPLRVVCDVRSPHSAALADEAERLGLTVVRTRGDITDFWFNDLAPQWKVSPLAIAGLTTHGPLFCLERFAWDHGLRVAFRGVHRFHDSGYIEHSLSGPFKTVASAHSALVGEDWPVHLARLLRSCAAAPDTAGTTVRSALARGHRTDVDDTLFSWVIAPKQA